MRPAGEGGTLNDVPSSQTWRFFLERCGAPSMQAVAHRALLLPTLDLCALLPSIHQPVLLICGAADRLVGRDCEEVLCRGLPNAAGAEIIDCGHLPQFTHPGIVADLVGRFLKPVTCPLMGADTHSPEEPYFGFHS